MRCRRWEAGTGRSAQAGCGKLSSRGFTSNTLSLPVRYGLSPPGVEVVVEVVESNTLSLPVRYGLSPPGVEVVVEVVEHSPRSSPGHCLRNPWSIHVRQNIRTMG